MIKTALAAFVLETKLRKWEPFLVMHASHVQIQQFCTYVPDFKIDENVKNGIELVFGSIQRKNLTPDEISPSASISFITSLMEDEDNNSDQPLLQSAEINKNDNPDSRDRLLPDLPE